MVGPRQFWMVWRDFKDPTIQKSAIGGANTQGAFKHWDFAAAMAEADRLAKNHPGGRFVVLQSTAYVEAEPPKPPETKASAYGQPDTEEEE